MKQKYAWLLYLLTLLLVALACNWESFGLGVPDPPTPTATSTPTLPPTMTAIATSTVMPAPTETAMPTLDISYLNWSNSYECATGAPIDGTELDLKDLEVVYNDETGEISLISVTLQEFLDSGILNLDWGGGPLLNVEPTAGNPLGGGGVSDAIFIENGEVVGSARAVNTEGGFIFTESTATGRVDGNAAQITLFVDEVPGGATLFGAGFSDGTHCGLLFSPDDSGLPLRPLSALNSAVPNLISDNPRLFCNPAGGTCTSSSAGVNSNPDGSFTLTMDGAAASGFQGVSPLSPDARVAEFTTAGWTISAGEPYGSQLYDWTIYTLAANGIDQGFLGVATGATGTYELQLFVSQGTDLAQFDSFLRELLDFFRGPL
ncbi:MAG: hypothetical protein KDE04_01435 [Anaerolineales bacterium]|nr:hypothetical protein [Anaerolineales bacterium]